MSKTLDQFTPQELEQFDYFKTTAESLLCSILDFNNMYGIEPNLRFFNVHADYDATTEWAKKFKYVFIKPNVKFTVEYKPAEDMGDPDGYLLNIEGFNDPIVISLQYNTDARDIMCEGYYNYEPKNSAQYKQSINYIKNLDENYNQNDFEIKDGVLIRYHGNSENVTIPNSVISIGYCAFWNCRLLKSIIIPNSVTSIGKSAFSDCENLISITIPNSVTSIEHGAFDYCKSLTSITIPDSVISIGEEAFSNCIGLTSITIPNSVTSIGRNAFNNCKNLESITIPNSITEIKDYTFYNCKNLEKVIISDSVKKIGYWAFAYCVNLAVVKMSKNINQIKENAFYYTFTFPRELNLYNIDIIEDYAFSESNLQYVYLDSIPSKVGDEAFQVNVEVILSDKAKKIQELKHYIQNLKEDYNQDEFKIKNGVLIEYHGNSKNITIPNSVTTIGESAFEFCKSLTSITIPNSVTSIEQSAFADCTNLKSITIPNSVKSIGFCAFNGCLKLTSITIPNSVTTIGESAFEFCESLTSITIPNSVTRIGWYAFSECTNLKSITIPNSITEIKDYTFYNCKNLDKIIIPNSVINIEDDAFSNCESLKSITIPDSVKNIKKGIFSGCKSLSSITIPNSVTSIGLYAFDKCTSLRSITIPNSVKIIEEYAFYDCLNLEKVIFESDYLYINDTAFNHCYKVNLEEIYKHDISNSVQNLKNKIQILEENINTSKPGFSKLYDSNLSLNEAEQFYKENYPEITNALYKLGFKFIKDYSTELFIYDLENSNYLFVPPTIKDNYSYPYWYFYYPDPNFDYQVCDNLSSIQEVFDKLKQFEYQIGPESMKNKIRNLKEDFPRQYSKLTSNGVYSLYKGWIKIPNKQTIPNNINLEPEYSKLKKEAKKCKTIKDIDEYIDKLHTMRQKAILQDGEYARDNLIFKKLRDEEVINDLKKLKVQLENELLSLK